MFARYSESITKQKIGIECSDCDNEWIGISVEFHCQIHYF